jgi:hypothetical protein
MANSAPNPSTLPVAASQTSAAKPLALRWRLLISAVVLFDLIAVVVAPAALLFPSETAMVARRLISPYIDATYLDHGYQFFAPEPGPSHLVRYRLAMPNGDLRRGEFPDLKTQWPRQFYHRHFMLSEKLTSLFPPPLPPRPPEVPLAEYRQAQAEYAQGMDAFRQFAKSYAQQLMRAAGAKRVHLELVEHAIAPAEEVAKGRRLDDPESYKILWQDDFEADPS